MPEEQIRSRRIHAQLYAQRSALADALRELRAQLLFADQLHGAAANHRELTRDFVGHLRAHLTPAGARPIRARLRSHRRAVLASRAGSPRSTGTSSRPPRATSLLYRVETRDRCDC